MKQRSLEVFSRDLAYFFALKLRIALEKNGGRTQEQRRRKQDEFLLYERGRKDLPRAFRDVKDRSALSGTTLTVFDNAKLDMYFNRNFSEWQPPNPHEGGAISRCSEYG